MYLKLLRAGALIAAASIFLVGCTPGKRPFLMVQMCLSSQQDVTALINELKSIASSEKFDFVDRSGDTARELKAVGYAGSERTKGSHVINVGVLRRDGMGLGAGNLGLPGYQIAIGFSEGSNAAQAHDFANRVLEQLRKHWRVEAVPAGTGAKPMEGCK